MAWRAIAGTDWRNLSSYFSLSGIALWAVFMAAGLQFGVQFTKTFIVRRVGSRSRAAGVTQQHMMAQMATSTPSVLDDKKVFYNRFLLIVAGLGGLLYGVDVGIIAGALPYLEATSGLNRSELSIVVAAVLLGSVFSTLFAGLLADWMGRKALMAISGVMFVVSIPDDCAGARLHPSRFRPIVARNERWTHRRRGPALSRRMPHGGTPWQRAPEFFNGCSRPVLRSRR